MGELALWTERTWWCASVWREEKRKEKAEWRELRGEVNFSRVGSDKDEAASTLSPSKNTRSTALMVARTCASPLFQTRETFTISLNPFAISARRSLAVGFPRLDGTLGIFHRYFAASFNLARGSANWKLERYFLLLRRNSSNCNSFHRSRDTV